ncbi:MAG TPA: hypothetical protein VFO58_14020 [Vicinamibacterales bacterium]|nr:hypothetical protein [Vicinamibacterales bacterium]
MPTRPGTFVDGKEASFVYFDASRRPCALEPLTAQARIRGTIGGRPVDGRFSFAATVQRLRLESVGRTPRDFVFTSEEGKETFVYQGAYRLLGTSADLVETILGLPLKAEDMRRVLTACPRISGALSGERFDERWFKVRLEANPPYDVYTRRDADGLGWSIQAIVSTFESTTDRWRAEFERDSAGLPRSVRVVSAEWNDVLGDRFDVRITFSDVRVNALLSPETFQVSIPAPFPTADVDGLRKTRPASAPFLVDPRVK